MTGRISSNDSMVHIIICSMKTLTATKVKCVCVHIYIYTHTHVSLQNLEKCNNETPLIVQSAFVIKQNYIINWGMIWPFQFLILQASLENLEYVTDLLHFNSDNFSTLPPPIKKKKKRSLVVYCKINIEKVRIWSGTNWWLTSHQRKLNCGQIYNIKKKKNHIFVVKISEFKIYCIYFKIY